MSPTRRSARLGLRGIWVGCALVALVLATSASAGAAVLEVTPAAGESVTDEIAVKTKAVKGVKRIERYLLIKARPHEVIGVEAEAPLRVTTPDGVVEASIETGRKFRKEDDGKNVALIGSRVYAEDYGYRGGMGGMATMKHLLEVGQTFKLTGETGPRVRVLGTLAAKPEAAAERVFLPLSTARKLFGRTGQVSHLVVVVDGDAEAAANELRSALGSGVQVKVISR